MSAIRIQTHRFGFVELRGSFVAAHYNLHTKEFTFDSPDYELKFVNVPLEVGERVYNTLMSRGQELSIVTDLYKYAEFSEELPS